MSSRDELFLERANLLAGGLCGAAGVGLSAAAAHVGGGNLATVAGFLLAHAPVFLLLGLSRRGRLMRAGGIGLLIGLLLFCGDLLARHYVGARLFPMAAPLGGLMMIAGWLTIAASAFEHRPPEA
ncbi:DUF423 domain-containing protein [Arvimicrobium flavum]|uniref:DUF423 domain-containing protein n=1 Tax=Arvimicrobium flavum TaxID=3393320 RepID=UPI00237A68A0|nr:DUF423 domain-containing protein [Mesorhizobium shangrilense]